MELTDTPLKPAMRRMRSIRRETGMPDMEIAMAWHILTKYDTRIFWHNGGTAGYRSFIGFDPAAKKGVVVLCNTSMDTDDIGRHLLRSDYPVATFAAPKERVAIASDGEILERYVGEYRFGPQFSIMVTREGTRLFTQATNQGRIEIFPETKSKFFVKVMDAQIDFETDDAGNTTGMVLHQNGRDLRALRVK